MLEVGTALISKEHGVMRRITSVVETEDGVKFYCIEPSEVYKTEEQIKQEFHVVASAVDYPPAKRDRRKRP